MTSNATTYDYVVVGAGSAGCVLANRLSAAGKAVLVLEAGEPDDAREVRIPAAFSELFKTEYDWEYYTEPQEHMDGRELYWPRGKMLGGSSSMNAMIYIRGHPADYDRWADLGNDGWGWADVLPYFTRSERNERFDDDYHGTDGPLNVADLVEPNPLSAAFVDAAVEAGYERVADFNDGEPEGVGYYQVTQKDGRRHSAAAAFLKPALDRPTLEARTGAHVTRVRFDGTRAVGVEYVADGERVQVDADEEVVLCGGAIDSPKLLLLSGIGPAEHLREHGIEVVVDSPGVGRNLQDHLAGGAMYECTEPVSLADADRLWNVLKYLALKRGPLTSNVAEAGGFVRTDPAHPPDLQFVFGPTYFVEHGFGNPDGHGFSVGYAMLQPESRGRITLRSADPFDDPAIDPDYLAEPADREFMVEGVRRVREIAAADAFEPYRGGEFLPGPDATTDEEILAVIRERAETLYHPAGTCKMGDDERAVVDDRLRVHGVEGLRVVDASVMPTVVRGNTNAPTIMIAEKAADVILEDAPRAAEPVRE